MNESQRAKLERIKGSKEFDAVVDKATEVLDRFTIALEKAEERARLEGHKQDEQTISLSSKLDQVKKAIDAIEVDFAPVIEALEKLEKNEEQWTETWDSWGTSVLTGISNITLTPSINTPDVNITTSSMDKYLPADRTKKYSGYLANDGSWFIGEESGKYGNKTFRYASGTKGYAKAWETRLKLEYKHLDKVEL